MRSEPRLRMDGVGRLGLPGWLQSQPCLASGTPHHQVWQGGEDPQSWVLSAPPNKNGHHQTKTVTIISQGWGQGQSALQGHSWPLAHPVQGADPRAEPGPEEQLLYFSCSVANLGLVLTFLLRWRYRNISKPRENETCIPPPSPQHSESPIKTEM